MTDRTSFAGRVALISGAGGGLGAAYAQWLAARGAAVVVNARRHGDHSPAQTIVDQIIADGGQAIVDTHEIDGSGEPEAAMVQTAIDAFGRLDILIANAAISALSPIQNADLDLYRRAFDVNVIGSIAPVLAALPIMRAHNYGRIVMTTSSSATFGADQHTAYAISKLGVVGFARCLGFELRKTGICINTISPYASTKMAAPTLKGKFHDLMPPERVAPVVGWMASEACDRSGLVFGAGAGRVHRVAIVHTQRCDDVGEDWTPNWTALDDLSQVTEPRTGRHSSVTLMPELTQ